MSQFRKQAPKPHPDYFWLLSGGIDSVAAFLLTKDALTENYQKRPIAVYLDTRVGLPLQHLYVQELCDTYDIQLWTLRTHEKYEDRVAGARKFDGRDDAGHPGPAQHSNVQNELKGRQREKLANLCSDKPIFVTGIRADESPQRAKKPKGEEKKIAHYVKPVYGLSKRECAEIILDHPECPINPLWVKRHFTDCGCGAHGDPSELRNLEDDFPWFAQRLREIEESANHSDVTDTWGWGGLTGKQQQALEAANNDGQMSLCGSGCTRRLDNDVVDMFVDDLDGGKSDDEVTEMIESELSGRSGAGEAE